MVDMDGFGTGGDVGGVPNTEDLRQLGNVSTGLLHLLGFNLFSILTLSLWVFVGMFLFILFVHVDLVCFIH